MFHWRVLRRGFLGLVLGVCLLSRVAAVNGAVRFWTDSTGKFRVRAEFVELVDGKVTLKRADNDKTVTMALDKLSKRDQDYVAKLMEVQAKRARAETPAAETLPTEPPAPDTATPTPVPTKRTALPARRPPSNVINSVRGAVYRTQTLNNLKQLGLALANYELTHQRFPTAALTTSDGKPGLSWRVAILPMIEEESLYQQFHLNEPWDSPHNRELAARMPAVFQSPGSSLDDGYTNYLAVVGKDSIMVSGKKGIAANQVPDGVSQTLMVVEADDTYATPWTKPDDYVVDENEPGYGLGGIWSGMFFGVMADGSPHRFPISLGPEALNGLFTRSGGEAINLEE